MPFVLALFAAAGAGLGWAFAVEHPFANWFTAVAGFVGFGGVWKLVSDGMDTSKCQSLLFSAAEKAKCFEKAKDFVDTLPQVGLGLGIASCGFALVQVCMERRPQ